MSRSMAASGEFQLSTRMKRPAIQIRDDEEDDDTVADADDNASKWITTWMPKLTDYHQVLIILPAHFVAQADGRAAKKASQPGY